MNASPRLHLTCPLCRAEVAAGEDRIGQTITCPNCLEDILVAPPAAPACCSDDRDFEFDVECPLCGSRLDAGGDQVGRTIPCPDCHTAIPVHEPPTEARRRRMPAVEDGAGGFRLSEPAETSVRQSIAHDLLDSAAAERGPDGARVAEQATAAEQRPARVPATPLTQKILHFLFSPNALARWCGLALALQVEMALIAHVLEVFGESGPQTAPGNLLAAGLPVILGVICFVAALLLGVVSLAVWSISMLVILQDTADGKVTVENWPGADFLDWLMDATYILIAVFVSALPGLVAGQVFVCAGVSSTPYTWGLAISCALTTLFVFPVVLLSMLEGGSPLVLISRPVWRSLWLVRRRWAQFFALAIGLGLLGLAAWQVRRADSVLLNYVVALLLVGVTMLYFRLLGRLTRCCQEADAEADALSAAPEREPASAAEAEPPG